MKITKDTVVTMHHKVVNAQGQLLDKTQEPTAYLHGGYDNTFPKIEEALEGQEVGFSTTLKLAPADAFGLPGDADGAAADARDAVRHARGARGPRFGLGAFASANALAARSARDSITSPL